MSDPTAPDPFCPMHGPARASAHAAAGCTCPVPPSPPPHEAKRFHSGHQVMEHYVPGYQRPAPEPSPYAPPPAPDVEALVDEMCSCANLLSDGPGVPWARSLLLKAAETFSVLSRRLQEAERHGYRLAMEVLQSELFRNPEDDIRAAVRYMTRNGPRA